MPATLLRHTFALLLYVCPAEFRREYGAVMRLDFADGLHEEALLHGALGAATFACGAYLDVLLTALREFGAMIFRDLTFAFRSLRKAPVFAAVIVATLALAIGANATVFSILRAVVLAPLPYADASRLVALENTGEGKHMSLSLPDFVDLRRQNRSFESAAAFHNATATLTGRGEPRRLKGIETTDGLFETLGVRPEIGRFIAATDSRAGAAPVVVVSDELWRSLGGQPGILEQRLVLEGKPYRIIGVAPADFQQPQLGRGFSAASYWVPAQVGGPQFEGDRGAHQYSGVARLRRSVSNAGANADVATVGTRLAGQYPTTNKKFSFTTVPLEESLVGKVRPVLFALFAAVAGVLLVACANVANLLLSRAASRQRELAVRLALGASRGRIVTQLLTETFVLALAGGAIGVGLALALVHAFVAIQPPGVPRVDRVIFDTPAALYTLGVVAFCTLAAGLAPAFSSTRRELISDLKAAGRGGDGSRGARARNALVTAEVALTLALVVAAGLVVRSFVALTHEPLGFEPAGVAIVEPVDLPDTRYARDASQVAFYQRAVARVRALPGVVDAAWSAAPPFANNQMFVGFWIADRRAPPLGEEPAADFDVVGSGYFRALRIPLLRGRAFADTDVASSRLVTIVNEAFAHEYFRNGGALGARINPGIATGTTLKSTPNRTIVGIAADTRSSYATAPKPKIYLPNTQLPFGPSFLVVRGAPGHDAGTAAAAAIPALDPLLPLPRARPMSAYLDADTAATRLSVFALGTLAFIALVLSIAGIYAIVSYGVTQRTHEFGVRMALGARSAHIVRNVMGRALRTALAGIALGLLFAALAARLLADQLYAIPPLDPATFGAVLLLIAAASACAALVPARRATRVDPIVALRYE